jgi:hypothetical protein
MNDKTILQQLAGAYAELANSDENQKTKERYKDLNSMRPVRPIVLVDEIPWHEFSDIPQLKLSCNNENARQIEQYLRRKLFQYRNFRGDMYLEPYYPLKKPYRIESPGIEIIEETISSDPDNAIVSHEYHDQLTGDEDLSKLHIPEVIYDRDLEDRLVNQGEELLGGFLPVKPVGGEFHFHPWDTISEWRGVNNLLLSLYDAPDFCHRIMKKMTEVHLGILIQLEKKGLLRNNGPLIHCTAGFADELEEDGPCTRNNMWGRGTAQIFGDVSPSMLEEFDLAYQKEFMEGFGLVYYGCCEPLHTKIDLVDKLPSIRKISITPWADVDIAAECMAGKYVMSRKPNPAHVAILTEEDVVAQEIAQTVEACRRNDLVCEFVLKDISTVSRNVDNLKRWVEITQRTITRMS